MTFSFNYGEVRLKLHISVCVCVCVTVMKAHHANRQLRNQLIIWLPAPEHSSSNSEDDLGW